MRTTALRIATERALRASVVARCSSLSAAWRPRYALARRSGAASSSSSADSTSSAAACECHLRAGRNGVGDAGLRAGRGSVFYRRPGPASTDVGAVRKDVNFGVARMPALVFARLVALMAFIVLPAGAIFLANYHTFEGVHEVRGCASCHVMLPMVNDMQIPVARRWPRSTTRTITLPRISATTVTVTTASAEVSRPR